MPCFYFHVCDGEGFCEDPEGLELPDVAAARDSAIRSARSMMVEQLMAGKLNLASFIEVEDEERNLLFTVTFEEAVTVEG